MFWLHFQVQAWLDWRLKNKPSKPSILTQVNKPPQAFTHLLSMSSGSGGQNNPIVRNSAGLSSSTAAAIQSPTSTIFGGAAGAIISSNQSTPASTPTKIIAGSPIIRTNSPRVSHVQVTAAHTVVTGSPAGKVQIQAGQQQQSIVLPVRTTPLTQQVTPVVSYQSSSTTPALPTHPAGANIQTVKIGAQAGQVWSFT